MQAITTIGLDIGLSITHLALAAGALSASRRRYLSATVARVWQTALRPARAQDSAGLVVTVFRRFYGQVTNVSAQGADSAISLCRCICQYPTFVRRIAATRIAIFRLSSRWGPDTKQTSDAIPIETAARACYDLFSV
jgi:hypothetical protein